MIENAKLFDVHDKDLTPAIYTFLFSNLMIELMGNDIYYNCDILNEDTEQDWIDSYYKSDEVLEKWQKRIDRGASNCFHNNKAMKSFIKNPCTPFEAYNELKKWLTDRGVTEKDNLIVKIWW